MGKVAAKKAPAKKPAPKKTTKQPIIFEPDIKTSAPPPPVKSEPEELFVTHPQVVTFNNQQVAPGSDGLSAGHRTVYFQEEGRRVTLLDIATFDTAWMFKENWEDQKKIEFKFRPRILFQSLQREVSKNGSNRKLRQYMQTVLPDFATKLKEPAVAATPEGEAPKQSKKETQVYRFKPKGDVTAMPRQAQLLYNALSQLQLKNKAEFVTLLEAEAAVTALKEELKTKQDPWRVFKFYQSQFIQKDLLRITNG